MSARIPENLVLVRHGEDRVGIDLASVREVLRMMRIQPLPGAPAGVLGVINVRGETIPVVDVESRLPAGARSPTIDYHLVVIGGEVALALAVTHVEDMESLETGGWQDAEGVLPDGVPLRGVARVNAELIPVLDPGRLLAQGEVMTLKDCLRRFEEATR